MNVSVFLEENCVKEFTTKKKMQFSWWLMQKDENSCENTDQNVEPL